MGPFMTYAEQHTVGVILVAVALAAILLCIVAAVVLGHRPEPKQRRDVADVNRAAHRAGFVDNSEVVR